MSIAANLVVRNEEKRLAILLPLLKNTVDEIVIVDQESTDNTVKLAEKYATVIKDEARGFADLSRPLAMANTKSDWIVVLDADEFITNRFRDDIPELIRRRDIDGYILHLAIIRQDSYDLQQVLKFGWENSLPHASYPHIYRLFRKGRATFGKVLHEHIHIPHLGTVSHLWYNAIVEIKTPKEQVRDEIRYAAVQNGYYDKEKHI